MNARTEHKMRHALFAAAAVLFMTAADFPVLAAEAVPVLETGITGNTAEVYIKYAGEEITSAQARIGTERIDHVAVEQDPQRIPMETYLMLDNSISIPQAARPGITELMTNLAAARLPGETFTLCTFSDHLEVVAENCSNYAELKAAVDSLQYNDQETYLTDVVSEVLDRKAQSEDFVYTRMVVISDGVDNNPGGLTRSELERRLETENVPIYTIGIKRNGNEQNLKEMYALSRGSRALYWTLEETPEPIQIAAALSGSEVPVKAAVQIPETLRDGSRKGLQLIVNGTETESVQVTMPFGEIRPTEEETGVRETVPETEPETEEEEEEEDPTFLDWILDHILVIAIVGLLLVGGIILLVLLLVSGKKKDEFQPYDYSFGPSMREEHHPAAAPMGGETEVLVGAGRQTVLCLEDINQPGRRFEVPLLNSLVIGKNPQLCQVVIDYDKTVSKRHCEIYTDGSMYRIRDLGSTNGTFVNGMRAGDGMDLPGGSILQLGRVELRVQYR